MELALIVYYIIVYLIQHNTSMRTNMRQFEQKILVKKCILYHDSFVIGIWYSLFGCLINDESYCIIEHED